MKKKGESRHIRKAMLKLFEEHAKKKWGEKWDNILTKQSYYNNYFYFISQNVITHVHMYIININIMQKMFFEN